MRSSPEWTAGTTAVHEVLARLTRLSEADHKTVVSDPRFAAKPQRLPTGDLDTDAQRVNADEIMLGQPQLTDTPEAPLDPNTEAEYMRLRLRKAAHIPGRQPPRRVAAPAARGAPGRGQSRGHLAQLAERYYRATARDRGVAPLTVG